MRRFIVTCGVACGIVWIAAGIGVLAGKGVTMSEIASDAAALDKMTEVERPAGKVDKWGGGVVPDLTKLGGPPKRVGLVTFFIKAHQQSEIDQTTARGRGGVSAPWRQRVRAAALTSPARGRRLRRISGRWNPWISARSR